MASEIRINTLKNRSGLSTVSLTDSGPIFTGIATFTGSVGIAGTLTYEDVTNVDAIGIITARTGINVTGGDITVSHSGLAVNIFESTDNHSRLRIKSADASLTQLEFADQSDADAGEIRYDHSSDVMSFHVGNNSERLRIGSSGQIGIAGANYGNAGQVLTSQGSGSAVAWTDQHSVLTTWTIPSDITSPGQTPTDITTWQQLTGTYHANLGYDSSLYSSGIFSYPSTGYYELQVFAVFKSYNNPTKGCNIRIYVTQDNNTYVQAVVGSTSVDSGQAGTNESAVSCKLFIKVTNTTNDKFRI